MSWFYRQFIRPLLFQQDPERAHERAMHYLARIGTNGLACHALESFLSAAPLSSKILGLNFPNPVGLAAGMDKYAEALPAWVALGFGFTELGAVTWHAQAGNPQPRLFRAVADGAIINRMGFNNPGAEALAQKLSEWRQCGRWPDHPVGINLGKSRITPLEKAAEDYANSFRVLHTLLDFFVVNVSSPNTPNLRQLQDKAALDDILSALQSGPNLQGKAHQTKPILVKIAPDLSFTAIDEILELVGPRRISGIIATNTTITRPETENSDLQKVYAENGGLSGRPLRSRSTEVIRHLYRQTGGSLPIIGVGGIFSAADAWEKITAGASLIQLYTGLIYEGPTLCKNIVDGLRQRLEQNGFRTLPEAVGSAK